MLRLHVDEESSDDVIAAPTIVGATDAVNVWGRAAAIHISTVDGFLMVFSGIAKFN
jgi:hypothetical protein